MKKIIISFVTIVTVIVQLDAVPVNDELVILHNVTTAEINAIVSPLQGSLIFNVDDSEVYERNATAWHRISSDGSDTKVLQDVCIEVNFLRSARIKVSSPYPFLSAGLCCQHDTLEPW